MESMSQFEPKVNYNCEDKARSNEDFYANPENLQNIEADKHASQAAIERIGGTGSLIDGAKKDRAMRALKLAFKHVTTLKMTREEKLELQIFKYWCESGAYKRQSFENYIGE